ncbi:MAG: CNNM domain-containing protein [Brevinematia bacterium]
MDPAQIIVLVVAIFSLIGSMFASFSELSLFIVDKVKLHKIIARDRKNGRYLKKLLENHRETLITILFLNLLFNTTFTIAMSNLTLSLNIIVSTIIISGVIAVLGEMLPKVGGYTIAERMVLVVAKVVYLVNLVGKPFFRFVNSGVIYPFLKRGKYLSIKDKAEFVEVLKRNARNPRIRKFIEILNLDAKDVMVPIGDTVVVDVNAENLDREIKKLKGAPEYALVYEGSRSNIVGAVRVGKLAKLMLGSETVANYLEPVNFAPETKRMYDLIVEMKSKSLSVSVIVDEYGNIIGMITPETLFDYIFGTGSPEIIMLSRSKYLVEGDISLKEFNEFFQTELESQFYNTISGFIIEKFGKIPNKGDEVRISGLTIRVNEVRGGKIESILVKMD